MMKKKSIEQPTSTKRNLGEAKPNRHFTYEDWWTGKVHLMYSTCVFKKEQPIVAGLDWDRFKKSDITRIRRKQREIYDGQLQDLIAEWKKRFSSSYKGSKLKEVLLQHELNLFYTVMFRQIPDRERVSIGIHKRLLFRWEDLGNIQLWIRSVIINGDKINYDSVHSPNCPYRETNKIPDHIYANACWNYYNWLKTFLPKKSNDKAAGKVPESPWDKEPYNSFIFKNRRSEKLFEDYCISFAAELRRTPMALLSFIYWKLRSDQLINSISPTQFREFLAALPANYELEKLKTLNKCTSADKLQVYQAYKDKYFS